MAEFLMEFCDGHAGSQDDVDGDCFAIIPDLAYNAQL